MYLTYTNSKKIRKSFGKIPHVTSLPNLIEVQKRSFDSFLQLKTNQFIRFKWEENDTKEDYFEFLIQVDEMTSDVSLIITDFAEDKQDQESEIRSV